MSKELRLPSAEDQVRLNLAWEEVLAKIDQSPERFPLRFGDQFDCPRCIFASADGWAILDIFRGSEYSRRFLPDDDSLLYDCAKGVTGALAGWHREKGMTRLSKALGRIYDRLDRQFDLRLQLRQQNTIIHRYQRRLMSRISPKWADRLDAEFRPGEIHG